MSEVDPLDLSNLQMLPNWVTQPQEKPKFKEEPVRRPDGKGFGRGGGGDRRGGPQRGRRDDDRRGSKGGPRPGGPGGPRPGGQGGPGGPRPGGQGGQGGQGRRDQQGQGHGQGKGNDKRRGGGGGGGRDKRGGPRRDQRGDGRQAQEAPPKDITLVFQPAQEGVAFIAQQIKTSGCAYPVFDLARLILNNRDRYQLIFEAKGDQKLQLCKLDGSLWLDRSEAVAHATTCKEFADYYKEETVTVDPPKGNFSSIAVCGLSGQLLGPPNHHSYQENIIRIHAERFSRMHIDGYKRKIRIERDDEIVEKWKEQQSTQSHFIVLKGEKGEKGTEGEEAVEPVVLKSRQEAIRHFSQNFASDLIREVGRATVAGDIAGRQLARPLFNLLVQEGERLRRFPMDVVQRLCRAFEKQGLKFFKEGKKTTYVARLRPRPITNESQFSDGIQKIVSYVRAHPNAKLNDLAGALIPESKRSAPPAPKKKSKRKPRKQRDRDRPTRAKRTRAFTIWAKPYPLTPAPAPAPAPAPVSVSVSAPVTAPTEKQAPAEAAEPRGSRAFTIWAHPKPDKSTDPVTPEAAQTQSATEAPIPAAGSTLAFTIWAQPHQPRQRSPKPPVESAKPPAPPPLTPEEIAVLQDLRWLIREGYVIEFSNGTLKLPRPHEAPKKKAAKKKVAVTQAQPEPKPADTPPPEQEKVAEPPPRKPDPTPTSAPPRA